MLETIFLLAIFTAQELETYPWEAQEIDIVAIAFQRETRGKDNPAPPLQEPRLEEGSRLLDDQINMTLPIMDYG